MKFYPIVILSKNNISNLKTDYVHISEPCLLLNQTTLLFNRQEITYDYLIFDDTILITNFFESNILHDEKIPVTNFYGVTSVENILYTKNINQAIEDIENNEI